MLPPGADQGEPNLALQRAFAGHEVVFAETPEAARQHLADASLLLSTTFYAVTREMLEQAPQLRLIQVAGVGVDHVDLQAAKEQGIWVANVTGANTISVAEHTVLALLALSRDLVAAHLAMVQGDWPLPVWMQRAHEVAGKTVGIVGMGRIGQEVAKRLAPFDLRLIYHDVVPLSKEKEESLGVMRVGLDQLVETADFVTLHTPLTSENFHLFDLERLRRMKPGSFLINTARAELIDEKALAIVLQEGPLAGAAIDVFEEELLPADAPLRRLPHLLLTPHGAGVTAEATTRISQQAVKNLLRFIAGQPLIDVVVEGRR